MIFLIYIYIYIKFHLKIKINIFYQFLKTILGGKEENVLVGEGNKLLRPFK